MMDFKGNYYLPRGVHEIGFRRKMSPCHVDVARLLHILSGQRLRPHKDGNGVPKGRERGFKVSTILEFLGSFLFVCLVRDTIGVLVGSEV